MVGVGSAAAPPAAFREHDVVIDGASVHVTETGDAGASPFLFLHGWPETSLAWRPMMALAARDARAIAVDLPGVGASGPATTDGSKRQLARVVHTVATEMALKGLTLVGQDVGGMIVYSYLREYRDLARAVIMDVVIPGVDPWHEVLRNPYLWHFAMHSIPELPETLVRGHERAYFDYFYDALSADPASIAPDARAAYALAYSGPGALTAGFDWYRAFAADAEANSTTRGSAVTTPVLYLRGDAESGDIAAYVNGLRGAGLEVLQHARIPNAGHFTQEEAPDATWRAISEFAHLA